MVTVTLDPIPRLMAKRRMNITDLRKVLGCAYSTAHRLYHGRTTTISLETIEILCRHFGVGPGELFDRYVITDRIS